MMIPKIVNTDSIKPASYNPRTIKEQQFISLKRSIKEFGMVIPLLVNSANRTIIAGHQRLKAAQAMGLHSVPVFFVKGIMPADEIKFNQIHNAIDLLPNLKSVGPTKLGYNNDPADLFDVDKFRAPFIKEISKLLIKYGNVLSCVVDEGSVVCNTDYVKACQLLHIPVNYFGLNSGSVSKTNRLLNANYGEYSYKKIERKTYVQGLAQLYRSATIRTDGKKRQASMLYEHFVIPDINKGYSKDILDFGAGKGAYIKYLGGVGVEFYNNNGHQIDISEGNRQINKLIEHLSTRGTFETVVCDSVLNSVDSTDAEKSVVRCCSAFLKEGGHLYISGRPLSTLLNKYNGKTDRYNAKRFLEFLDDNNFSANFRRGHWYFQHWHTQQSIETLLSDNGFKIDEIAWAKYGDSFQIKCTKISSLSASTVGKAIDFEFNLPLPNGKRYHRGDDVKMTLNI